ncbi:MAG: ChaN family lipoprotein [Sneathiella sp.]|nr:ChaN family lipoprotein [Sneathiella sp.]
MSLLSKQSDGCWVKTDTGTSVSQTDVLQTIASRSVILIGETHNRADHHLWQLDMCQNLRKIRAPIAIGFEMFPKRAQYILDQWTRNQLSEPNFLKEVDWDSIWGFDPALYLPLFQFCKDHGISMIALNCNRPLVTEIGKQGWENVDPATLEGLTPAKPATVAYRQYLFDVTGGKRSDRKATHAGDPAFDRFVRAQQVWDRAFACNLNNFHKIEPDTLLIGLIGSGHLEYGGGTPYQLADLGLLDVVTLIPTDTNVVPQYIGNFVYKF